MTLTNGSQSQWVKQFSTGFTDIMPLSFGVAIYGLTFGLLAAQINMDGLTTGAMGVLVFAGSSQIVAVERLAAGASVGLAVLAGLALNLRILLMTASLRHELKGRPWWQIILGVHLTSDENWALMHATRARGQIAGYWYLIGGGASLISVWFLATTVGASSAGTLPDLKEFGIDFAFTAAFILLLRNLWRDNRDLAPCFASAATAGAFAITLPIDPSWGLIAGGLVGAIFAARGAHD